MSPYRRPFPNTWWLKRRPYFLFMIRELTSVFVAGYCVFLLVFVYKLGRGAEEYASMIELIRSPLSIVLQCITLAFVLYHSVTWFNLTPKILVLRIGEERIPQFLVAGTFYAGWIAVSALIAWLLLGG